MEVGVAGLQLCITDLRMNGEKSQNGSDAKLDKGKLV